MRSAFECLQRAARCEQMAQAAEEREIQWWLSAAAVHWRLLAQEAAKAERAQNPPDERSPSA